MPKGVRVLVSPAAPNKEFEMRIVILTGAGISAESGLATFRAEDGLWSGHSIEDVATPQGYKRNPQFVLDFYNDRRKDIAAAKPNTAHHAIAKLQKSSHEVFLVTQNVDDLHEKAGSNQVCHMHGSIGRAFCTECGIEHPAKEIMLITDECVFCSKQTVRPDIVWFGEEPYNMLDIDSKLRMCNYFLAIGTSGNVYPAAGFARIVKKKIGKSIEFNIARSENANDFHQRFIGAASVTVSEWVDKFLEETNV